MKMRFIDTVAHTINTTIDTSKAYVYDNALSLAVLLVIAYYVRTNGTIGYFFSSFLCLHLLENSKLTLLSVFVFVVGFVQS